MKSYVIEVIAFICVSIIIGFLVFSLLPQKETQVLVEEIVSIPTLVKLEGRIDLLSLTQIYQLKLLKKQSEQIETLAKAQQVLIRRLE